MRETFTYNQLKLLEIFRGKIFGEATLKLTQFLAKVDPEEGVGIYFTLQQLHNDHKVEMAKQGLTKWERKGEFYTAADETFRSFVGDPQKLSEGQPIFYHWWESLSFNINSTDHLRTWLFSVKGFTPLKTTKKDGIQTAWERVMALPPEKRAEYTPAADKMTIKVFAEQDSMVGQIQELKAVGNIVKAFLRGPDEEGKEQGLHKWIQPDGRIHANFALTETHRPRAWKPNILNWPKAVTKPIEKAFERLQATDPSRANKPCSLRSCIQAPPGWAFIDMDLKTAEIVALAYTSGDTNLLNVLYAPDTQFAFLKKKDEKTGDVSEKQVRIAYNEITKAPESKWTVKLVDKDHEDLVRKADGSLVHPGRDLHWEFGEVVKLDLRENLDKEAHRGGIGKVGNFSIPYGATGGSLERLIEANTGKKPPVGTGDQMIEGYEKLYPTAWRFLLSMERIVEDPGYYRSVTGAVRHFYYNNLLDVHGLRDWTRKSILSPLTRQARNYPMQHIVAATTAKALIRFVEERRKRGMQARVMMLLYDAVTAIAPLEELREAAKLLQNCLTVHTPWTIHGRTFTFDVDTDFSFRWAVKPTKDEKGILTPYTK
jgi:hypothetical protein